nr:MGMT family protein [Neisseria mucosa]
MVGSVLHHAADYGDYPCHRVVNASGRLVPGWAAQQAVACNRVRAFGTHPTCNPTKPVCRVCAVGTHAVFFKNVLSN